MYTALLSHTGKPPQAPPVELLEELLELDDELLLEDEDELLELLLDDELLEELEPSH